MKIIPELEGAVFGLVDGIVCFLGLIIGVGVATHDPNLVIITGIITGMANAFGNSIGFFISQSTERGIQIHAARRHRILTRPHSRKEVILSGIFSFLTTAAALVVLLFPFLLFDITVAIAISAGLGLGLLFLLGLYVGKLSEESKLRTGIKYVCLGAAGAVICYLVGTLLSFFV